MTQAEELAELRRWMREDIGGLHKKLEDRDRVLGKKFDDYTIANKKEHDCLQKQLSSIDKKTEVGAVKIGLLVALLTIAISGVATACFHSLFA